MKGKKRSISETNADVGVYQFSKTSKKKGMIERHRCDSVLVCLSE